MQPIHFRSSKLIGSRSGRGAGYWVPTVLVALVSVPGGFLDAIQTSQALEVFRHLGYPAYFSTLLGVAKVLGGLAILIPVPRLLREWAYAGLIFDVTGGIVSILASGDGLRNAAFPVVFLGLAIASYRAWRKADPDRQGSPEPRASALKLSAQGSCNPWQAQRQ